MILRNRIRQHPILIFLRTFTLKILKLNLEFLIEIPKTQIKNKSKDNVAKTDGKLTLNLLSTMARIKEKPRPTNPIMNPQIAPTNKTTKKVFVVIGKSTLGVALILD